MLGVLALLALASLVGVGVAAYRSLQDLKADIDARARTSQAIRLLGSVLADLLDAQVGQRGYILTGSEPYLQPYRLAVEQLAADTRALADLARTDSLLGRSFTQLTPIVREQLGLLRATIELRQAGASDSAMAIVRSGRSLALMDRIRETIQDAESVQVLARNRRTAEIVDATRSTQRGIFVSVALTGGLLVLATGLIAFQERQRGLARRQIESLNARLARQVVELESVNRELEAFNYSVSHDLRAPLRAIDGFSRMLQEDHAPALDAEARRLLDVIQERARRMGRLIDDLLRLSRVGRQALEPVAVDMEGLVRGVLEELRPGARVEVRVGPLPGAMGDAALLRQVWGNLLGNAVKYSGKRDRAVVEIAGARNGREVTYTVRDNGVGFDPAYRDKLFGIFQRLHRVEDFDGTGVGLAIVQRIVARHGGRVWADGALERGAEFGFALPAMTGDTP